MNIRTTRIYYREWMAVDDDTYDGSPDSKSLCGVGSTEQEAIADLLEQLGHQQRARNFTAIGLGSCYAKEL